MRSNRQKKKLGLGVEGTLERSPSLIGERRISPGFFSGLRPLRAAKAVLQPLPVLHFYDHAGPHPLWGCIGQFAEVVSEDRDRKKRTRFPARGLQFLEYHGTSIV